MQAHATGWDTLRLFGVSPTLGAIRSDDCGVLIPASADAHEVTAEWVSIGLRACYRHELVKVPVTIPIREFKR